MGERVTPHLIEVRVHPGYSVTIGCGTLTAVAASVSQPRLALVSDDNVAPLYAPAVRNALEAGGADLCSYTVPAGENSKSPERWLELQRAFAADGLDRGSAVVALGGGVVGDLAGFAAATYLRGLAWYQVPTSLLAMVDTSVGGKTAINLPAGKNLVGAFWQPSAVIADVSSLATLPAAAFRQGAVELFKHGLLADRELLDRFEVDVTQNRSETALAAAIARSVAVKADIVARDERESGVRAYLNLGHTLAHALEAVSGHALPHGDAVAYGLHYAALLARNRGMKDLTARTGRLLSWERPAPLPAASFDDLLPFLALDKKNRQGRHRFVLLEDVSRPVLVEDVSKREQLRAWQQLSEEVGG